MIIKSILSFDKDFQFFLYKMQCFYNGSLINVPQEYCQELVIDIDDIDFDEDEEQVVEDKELSEIYERVKKDKELKISPYEPDYSDPDVIEMCRTIDNLMGKQSFENYIDWYVNIYQGTLEQPYQLLDSNGGILTAKNYYNYKSNTMVEMRVIFDEGQTDNVRAVLTTMGFMFEDSSKSLLTIKETMETMGSIDNPYVLLATDNESMYYVYNNYDADKNNMVEMRVVFDRDQFHNVKNMLKQCGFVVDTVADSYVINIGDY